MRKEPFLSHEQDDDDPEADLEFSRKGELPARGQTVPTRQKVALSGISLFFAALATIGICVIAAVMVYRTFVVPM